jgi:hypothetical protein
MARRPGDDLNNAPVVHARYAVGEVQDACIVRDADYRPVDTPHDIPQEPHHAQPRLMIKAAGRLVADHQRGIMHYGSGNRHALLLADAEMLSTPGP